MQLLKLMILALLTSCWTAPRRAQHTTLHEQLESKRANYQRLTYGSAEGCDSLLFSALGTVGGANVDILDYRNSDGQWFRTPEHTCYLEGRSKSTISRDMLLGVYWWAWNNKRLDVLEDLWDYGLARRWKMGDGPASRTILTPLMISTLTAMIEALGGEQHGSWAKIPIYWTSEPEDFQAHLRVLHILLRKQLPTVDFNEDDTLADYADKQPNNALFQYAAGNEHRAITLLLNSPQFPNHRLPTSDDRCEEYIFQRDYGDDWQPCPDENETYLGFDLLFLSQLILGDIDGEVTQ